MSHGDRLLLEDVGRTSATQAKNPVAFAVDGALVLDVALLVSLWLW